VRARVERFSEPMLLLLLREQPTHGYELLEQLEELGDGERVDVGNLYRVLRSLEQDGLVSSEWNADLPGPAKRTYRITDEGRRLLEEWAAALERARGRIDVFLDRYRKGGEHVPRT
jgi:PadR family transcriptional regulator PadR